MENDMTETTLLTKAQRACAIDIMTNAFETGIAYWVTRAKDLIRDDELNYLRYLLLPEDSEPGTWFEVTPEKVWAAVEKIASGEVPARKDIRQCALWWTVDEDYMETANPDAETDDVAVQVAIFGKIVYG